MERDYTTSEEWWAGVSKLKYLDVQAGLTMCPVTGTARSPLWPATRRKWLDAHPRCASCGGRDALEVHHMKPFHLHPELELDDSNFITLCEHPGHCCHFTWGHTYNWSLFNPDVIPDTTAWLHRVQEIHGSL